VATKQAPVILSDSDDGLSEPMEEDSKPSKVSRTAKPMEEDSKPSKVSRTARATKKVTKYIESDDEPDNDDDEFSLE